MDKYLISALLYLCCSTMHAGIDCSIIKSMAAFSQRFDNMANSAGVRLGDKIDRLLNANPNVHTHPRFNNQDGLDNICQAQLEINASLGAAESIAPDLIGPQTADRWVDIATSDRVIDSVNISFQDSGAGLGYIVRDSGLTDAETSELLKGVAAALNENPTFKSMNASAAHVLDSIRELRARGVPIPDNYWGTGSLRNPIRGGFTGSSAELTGMAEAARNNRVISEIGIDTLAPIPPNAEHPYHNSGIDHFKDNDRMVQVALNFDARKKRSLVQTLMKR